VTDAPAQHEIETEAIHRMHAALVGALPLMPVLPCVVAAALWPRQGGWALGLWLVAALLPVVLRGLQVRRFAATVRGHAGAVRWANESTAAFALGGLAWGLAGWLLLPTYSHTLEMALIALIVGMAVGLVPVAAYWPRAAYAFALPAVGLTALGLALAQRGGEMVAGLAVFLGVLRGMVAQAHGTAMETIRLRFEKDALMADLQRQKELAEQASQDKSRFLAAASHDLRQPLHALGLFVQALRERTGGTPQQELAERIGASVDALEGLLNALLDVSRLDAGVLRPCVQPVPLRALAERLGAEFAPLAQAQGLAWRCEGPDVAAATDPALLETLLRNLLANAVRYTPRGEVALAWQVDGAHAVLSVRDTGIGIAPEFHGEVFREFVQLHNPGRDRAKGLGLGLAVVDRLARLLEHRLALRSAPGQGSTFELRLPLTALPEPEPEPETETCSAPSDGPATREHGLRVLVIDDEADVRAAMAEVLGGWGCKVLAAASAQEALALLEAAPQAIVADYRLQDGRTGAEAIAAVREAWGAGVAALIVTGDTAAERLREIAASGHPVLHKPVPPARLRAFLRNAAHEG